MSNHARFWSKVSMPSPDACWEWQRARKGTGRNAYGVYGLTKTRTIKAHRYSWEFWFGPIPTDGPGPHGWCVLHRCDNPPCVNPAHLFLGTQPQNVADMRAKERCQMGEECAWSKLTEEKVRDIRRRIQAGERATVLGKEYGVGWQQIGRIARGTRWAWVK